MEKGKMRILVIDDEEAILLAFKKLLKRPYIEIDTSDNLEETWELINSNMYCAAIADLRLSGTLGLEGFEIISYLKKTSPSTIVALITAYGSHEIEQMASALGADFYFEKPVTIDNLNQIINEIDKMYFCK